MIYWKSDETELTCTEETVILIYNMYPIKNVFVESEASKLLQIKMLFYFFESVDLKNILCKVIIKSNYIHIFYHLVEHRA